MFSVCYDKGWCKHHGGSAGSQLTCQYRLVHCASSSFNLSCSCCFPQLSLSSWSTLPLLSHSWASHRCPHIFQNLCCHLLVKTWWFCPQSVWLKWYFSLSCLFLDCWACWCEWAASLSGVRCCPQWRLRGNLWSGCSGWRCRGVSSSRAPYQWDGIWLCRSHGGRSHSRSSTEQGQPRSSG